MNDEVLTVLADIRNWIRASSYSSVKTLLQEALPDAKTRAMYQMLDGTKSTEQIRTACKTSPNAVIALAQKCTSMGLVELKDDKRRVRLFDLADFGLIPNEGNYIVDSVQDRRDDGPYEIRNAIIRELLYLPGSYGRMLLMLNVCLDESGHETKDHVVIAGFFGSPEKWDAFLPEWREAVGSDSFHMKDLRWKNPATQRRLERLAVLPYKHGLRAAVGAVRVSDYADLLMGPIEQKVACGYSLALYPIIVELLKSTPKDEPVNWVFEEQRQYEGIVGSIFSTFDDFKAKARVRSVQFVSSESAPCTQVADFLAYAVLQHLRNPESDRAKWSSPIMGEYVGRIMDRASIREVILAALPAAAILNMTEGLHV